MKMHNILGAIAVALIAAACIPSVHPFYTERDLDFDPQLIGEWKDNSNPKEPQSWNFQKADEKSYKLVIKQSEGKEGEFSAHLFKLKDHRFLDLVATDVKLSTNTADLVGASLIPGHLILRVLQIGDSLKLAFIDSDWLEKELKAHPESLPHIIEQERPVLTASTKELQAFVQRHLGENELFGEPGELFKTPPETKK